MDKRRLGITIALCALFGFWVQSSVFMSITPGSQGNTAQVSIPPQTPEPTSSPWPEYVEPTNRVPLLDEIPTPTPTPEKPRPKPKPKPRAEEKEEDVYYARCADVPSFKRPLQRGEPGYRSELDRDDDGDACE